MQYALLMIERFDLNLIQKPGSIVIWLYHGDVYTPVCFSTPLYCIDDMSRVVLVKK